MTFRAVLFDIDGTLVDNMTICTGAYLETLRRCTGRQYAEEDVSCHFGKTEEGILAMFVPGDQVAGAVDIYFNVYADLHQAVREPVAGMRAILDDLQDLGIPLGIVTGKSLRLAEVTLEALGLRQYFPVVEGGFVDRADKAESMRRAVRRFGLEPESVLYIGDTAYDIASAAAAGVPVVGAAWAATTTIRPADAKSALRVFYRVADFAQWLGACVRQQEDA